MDTGTWQLATLTASSPRPSGEANTIEHRDTQPVMGDIRGGALRWASLSLQHSAMLCSGWALVLALS